MSEQPSPPDRGSIERPDATGKAFSRYPVMAARIAHLSDIHFGRHDPAIVAAAEEWLRARQPDLIVISGDFTQRARIGQFRQARAWLDRLRAAGFRLLLVPGNHDVPLYDIFRRFASPLRRYKYYISDDLCPWYEDDAVAILGLNTARSLTIKDGRINHAQMDMLRERFAPVPGGKTRILVTHHPLFEMPIGKGNELSEAVGQHEDAVAAVRDAGIHIALAGHFHRTYAEAAYKMVANAGGALVVQAGTATSTRLRNDEPQSFNWLHAHHNNAIELQVIVWNGARFERAHYVEYDYAGGQWTASEVRDPDGISTISPASTPPPVIPSRSPAAPERPGSRRASSR
jgi:3',5'-cyclic AMP phosphodiesterase CpdA